MLVSLACSPVIQDLLPNSCSENDQLFPEEILDTGRKHLATSNVEHEIKTYSGVPHGNFSSIHYVCSIISDLEVGFAVAGDYQEAHIKEAQSSAFEQMLRWLKAH